MADVIPRTGLPADNAIPAGNLPAELRASANGQLDGEVIVAWSEYDVDAQNRYARSFVVLTETKLILLGAEEPLR